MNTVILERDMETEEKQAAEKYFGLEKRRTLVPNSLIIGRYAVLPFYKELVADLEAIGSKLVNSHREHLYIADMRNWYEDLSDLTPKTWFYINEVPEEEAPYVLKGATNSQKFLWNTHMFAKTKKDVIQVYLKLKDDTLIGYQDIYVRKFVPLHTYMLSSHGLPITKEFRFFFYKEHLLSGGFYWSSHTEDITDLGIEIPSIEEVPKSFLKEIARRVSQHTNFYVVDVAMTEEGEWIVIELNDGQMSGLSENDPNILYANLAEVVMSET